MLINALETALSAFIFSPASYIFGGTQFYFPNTSSTACAGLCTRNPQCLSFTSGFGTRTGDCFVILANLSTPGTTFHPNK